MHHSSRERSGIFPLMDELPFFMHDIWSLILGIYNDIPLACSESLNNIVFPFSLHYRSVVIS